MSPHLTVFCIILCVVVVNAQVDEELQASYSDNNKVYDDEDVAYGDYNGTYDNGYDTKDDEFGEYDYEDYEDIQLATISFSAEKFKEFYSCLCLGTFKECEIHYSQEGDTMNVDLIKKTGSLQGESDHCKHYMCAHVWDKQQVSCVQAEMQSKACKFGTVAQFFRLKSYDCCGSTCVGLYWSSAEEQMNFFQNSSDIDSCNATCLCSSEDTSETRVTKITVSPLSNETQIDTYIIHKTQPTSDTSATKTEVTTTSSKLANNMPPVSLTIWRTTTTTSLNTNLDHGSQNMSSSKNFGDNENSKATTIIVVTATIVCTTVVLICVIVIVVICRRKRKRKMTMNVNNNKTPDTGTALLMGPDPELSNFRPVKVNESAPTYYSQLPARDEATTSINSYEQSPKVPGFSKNGVNVLENADMGNGDSNSLRRESVHSKPELATDINNVAVSSSYKGYNDDKTRQPLLNWPPVKESVI